MIINNCYSNVTEIIRPRHAKNLQLYPAMYMLKHCQKGGNEFSVENILNQLLLSFWSFTVAQSTVPSKLPIFKKYFFLPFLLIQPKAILILKVLLIFSSLSELDIKK